MVINFVGLEATSFSRFLIEYTVYHIVFYFHTYVVQNISGKRYVLTSVIFLLEYIVYHIVFYYHTYVIQNISGKMYVLTSVIFLLKKFTLAAVMTIAKMLL